MALCAQFLLPNFLLTANQAISIASEETTQPFHTDDAFYMLPRPRPMISLSTIVAVADFTSDNGGTQVVPASYQ
jgi:ectoine hydroxylase-related dioxygenase (phytanoyl-CoA dioxygenase family)